MAWVDQERTDVVVQLYGAAGSCTPPGVLITLTRDDAARSEGLEPEIPTVAL